MNIHDDLPSFINSKLGFILVKNAFFEKIKNIGESFYRTNIVLDADYSFQIDDSPEALTDTLMEKVTSLVIEFAFDSGLLGRFHGVRVIG